MTKFAINADQNLSEEQQSSDAFLFLKKLSGEQTISQELVPKIQDALQHVTTHQLLDFCVNNQTFQMHLIQVIFLEREDFLYRQGTGRKDIRANWSDKLISLVGKDGKTILNKVLNHQGDPVRTKTDPHFKAAEREEIMGEHSAFLENKQDSSVKKVMAEVADAVYNLAQLTELDPKNKEHYIAFLVALAHIYKVPVTALLSLVIAKYHYRMYVSQKGTNAHDIEGNLVDSVIQKYFTWLVTEESARTTINESFGLFNEIFPVIQNILELNMRLLSLQQYLLDLASSDS